MCGSRPPQIQPTNPMYTANLFGRMDADSVARVWIALDRSAVLYNPMGRGLGYVWCRFAQNHVRSARCVLRLPPSPILTFSSPQFPSDLM